jgi:hypothetical protein
VNHKPEPIRAEARLSLVVPRELRRAVEKHQQTISQRTGCSVSLNSAATSLLKQALQQQANTAQRTPLADR